ncbi:MAG: helix-turn-helix transcriptional regulator [Lawsonibacter sp.]|jgi:transcriptional regulator with XRE-family HTH domain|uniref:helix-turn-helix domain-containing protein n=1 Tax=Lawsonibacter sp. JLR.KK007 TaxID=3114293 RepID=UPI00216FB6AC|nr:helix-turn-helix transcriptional regulator [Lawsonibacter sp.]MCI8990151.1 helix-turn-helix transcriptional regulator [Lawsonibacter sp.]MCI9268501.1 helix-turn-helix transcriptional regulator [Lawsonibacter sp.]
MSNFALRMKELRKEKKLKQQELADEFSVKLRTYQGYEYGESYPEVAKLLAIADFFDVSLDYLMGRSDVRERQ